MKKPAEDDNVEQAAIFLMSLQSEDASKLLQYLGPKEVQKIGLAMAGLENVDKKTVQKSYDDFIKEAENKTSIGLNKDEQIRKVLIGALGEEKASSIIDKILAGSNTKGLETLRWMDAKLIAEIIKVEHPQIQAIVLSYLEPDQAAETLMFLDEKIRLDLIVRIAMQEKIQPSALDELNQIMEKQMMSTKINQTKSIGGINTAANILNCVESSVETDIMEALKEKNEDLANQISELMFVFENMNEIDDKGMQVVLREVKTDTLVIALKGADEELKAKIFKNMSKRAAELLKDDLEIKGPVRVSEVEAAQKEILAVVKNLADAGKIFLSGKGEEMI